MFYIEHLVYLFYLLMEGRPKTDEQPSCNEGKRAEVKRPKAEHDKRVEDKSETAKSRTAIKVIKDEASKVTVTKVAAK